jgi:hypothetical protein
MWADLRHRYEQTPESIDSIARFAKLSHQTMRRYAEEGQWIRFVPPPLDIPEAAKLAARAVGGGGRAYRSGATRRGLSFPPPAQRRGGSNCDRGERSQFGVGGV